MISALLALAALVHHATSQPETPRYEHDYRAAPDCIGWADIEDSTVDTCNATREYYHIDPARFRAWNPSVGLDCTPWSNQTSYCVLTNATWEDAVFYSTQTTTLTEAYRSYAYTVPLVSLTTDSAGYTIRPHDQHARTHPQPRHMGGQGLLRQPVERRLLAPPRPVDLDPGLPLHGH